MSYSDLFESLLMVIYLLKDENGVTNMHDVTSQLHQRGLLSTFADDDVSFQSLLDTEEYAPYIERVTNYAFPTGDDDTSGNSETSHDDIQIEGTKGLRLTSLGLAKAEELNRAKYNNPQSLFNWGFMASFDSKLKELADMALPENWTDGEQPYGILRAYITNTFKRLLHMRKSGQTDAIVEGGKWAVFNTGLVDRLYDPIFALFSANRKPGLQKWVFNSWCTPGNRRSGQILSRHFSHLPRKATYFDTPEDLLYDPSAGIPTLPFEHILERLERLPLSFLATYKPKCLEWPAGDFTPDQDFFDEYRDALYNDDHARLCFKDALELSLRRAIKKVKWNYRMVIPIYDTKRRRLMQLIPMSLDFVNNNNVDIALMVEKAKVSGKYIGHTILTPGMAYRKARMVMTQEADWLSASLLNMTSNAPIRSDEDVELDRDIIESDANASAITSVREREEAEDQMNDDDNSFGYLTQHDDDVIFRPEIELNTPKVLGKMDVSNYDKSFLFGRDSEKSENLPDDSMYTSTSSSADNDVDSYYANNKKVIHLRRDSFTPDRDYDIPGIYKHNYGKPYILVGKYRYQAREFTDYDLIDDDEVIFDIRKEPNLKNTGTFCYAVNIRLADEYEFIYDEEED